ncbi:translation initiation factor IF-2-like [Corvus kubaryi]|uniref:translation initiation factor IF-2-like n=1 Tax=Corvus kubaryi TaxID=68294 RepID=UPI001C04C788|nr:translation initiation factor IF-2-like [Corvus kubaryi]XP_041900467.1 translation initiation factor IF-2-like [Corvus kubaryi]
MADIKPRLAASFSQPQRHSHSHTASRRARARRRPGGARAARPRRRGLGSAGRCERPERDRERGRARSCRSGIGAPGSGAQPGAKAALISVCGTAPPAAKLCLGAALHSCRSEAVGAAPSPSPRGEPPLEPRLTMTALGNLGERGGEVQAPTFPASWGPDRGTAAPGSEFTPTRVGCGAPGRGRSGAPRVGGSDRGAPPGAPFASGRGAAPQPQPPAGLCPSPRHRTEFESVLNKGEARAPTRKR